MGVLPSQDIRKLLKTGLFPGIDESYINPGSLDLPVSDEIYRMRKLCKPKEHEDVLSLVHEFGERIYTRHLHGYVLEVGVPYLIRVGHCVLPEGIYAYANPKSSIGRINVLVRIVVDNVPKFDTLKPSRWHGDVWMYVQPRSFPICLQPGIALAQLRFLNGKGFVSHKEFLEIDSEFGTFFDESGVKIPFPLEHVRPDADDLHMTLRADSGHVGWVADGGLGQLDLSKRDVDHRNFFRPLEAHDGGVDLHPGRFHIFTTNEGVKVPPKFSAELRPLDARVGEFRVHSAGFIDPGWGYDLETGGVGNPITLEVTTSELSVLHLRHGEIVARIRFEHMTEEPDELYGGASSNYGEQKVAQLAKFFR